MGASYIENIESSEKMALRQKKGTFVFDVVYEESGEKDEVTLDTERVSACGRKVSCPK